MFGSLSEFFQVISVCHRVGLSQVSVSFQSSFQSINESKSCVVRRNNDSIAQ